MRKTLLAAAIVITASACTIDPYTGEKKFSKTAIGALAGAAIGAASSSSKDRKKGALIGATVGAGAGYYMDRQEAKLRQELASSGVSVTREGEAIKLNMPGNLTFHSSKSDIQPSFNTVLDAVAKVFGEYKKTNIRVAGFTDSTGAEQYNMMLSKDRANSVAQYFYGKGVDAQRFEIIGFGEKYPAASNDTASGREANRRVELEIIPS